MECPSRGCGVMDAALVSAKHHLMVVKSWLPMDSIKNCLLILAMDDAVVVVVVVVVVVANASFLVMSSSGKSAVSRCKRHFQKHSPLPSS